MENNENQYEEEVVYEDGEMEEVVEETQVEQPKKSNKGKFIRRGLAGVLVVAAIVTITSVLVKNTKKPQEEPTPETTIGDVTNDIFKEETGIENSSLVVKEGETLPWFVSVSLNEEGEETYRVFLSGDYDQFINVEPEAGNDSSTLRAIMALNIDKETFEAGKEGINKAIKEAKEEDFAKVCSYNVDDRYEGAVKDYCSLLDEYKDVEFDWDSAKMIDLDAASSLTGYAYTMEKGDTNSVVALYNFIDANGKVLNVALGAEYVNLREKKQLVNTINGTLNTEYVEDMFDAFELLNDEDKELLNETNAMNVANILLTGSYKEPKVQEKEEDEVTNEEELEPLSTKNGYTINIPRNL